MYIKIRGKGFIQAIRRFDLLTPIFTDASDGIPGEN
jgi:hypothetical protein